MNHVIDIIGPDYEQAAGDKHVLNDRMLTLLDAQPGEKILDAGCGDGKVTQLIAGKAEVTGIDIDTDLIAKARARGLDIEEMNIADIGKTAAFYARFDKVFSNLAVQWLKDDDRFRDALAGFNYALKKGGKAVISFPTQLHPAIEQAYVNAMKDVCDIDEKTARDHIPIRHTSQEQLVRELRRARFTPTAITLRQRNQHALKDGIRPWLKNFLGPHMFKDMDIVEAKKEAVFAHMVAALAECPDLHDKATGQWYIAADMFIVTAQKQLALAQYAGPAL